MRRVLLIVPLALASCGLGLGGLERSEGLRPDAGTVIDASPVDDAQAVGPLDATGGSCLASIPAGWGLVVLEESAGACPAGFTSHDLLGNPMAGPGACSCSCNLTSQPSCDVGMLQGSFAPPGGSAGCATKVAPLSLSGGNCTQLEPGGAVPSSIAIDPLPPTGGSCVASAVGDTSQVTTSAVRTCDVVGPGSEGICSGSPPALPQGFAACITSPGDVACPTSSPFSTRSLVAVSQTLVCSACSSCAVTSTCSDPTVTFFSDYLCANPVATLPADGSCTQPGWTGTIAGVEYHAQVTGGCAASGSSATFEPGSPQTLCCR